ncbi:Ldh family oxidoreductase [Rhodopseudomonas palustris]|uniref:(R)-2-hydroxyacid dehydrogenase n=1 Tax=Rhodopseudomonas palustris (strain BisB18) TaxID=316056 RepID=Q21D51_RHOPB
MIVEAERVRSCAVDALMAAGVLRQDADQQVDLLLEAELRGRPSHGLLRLARIVERIDNGVIDPRASGCHHWKAAGFLEVDGQNGLGPVVALSALEAISLRARETGVAVATIVNANHLGMLAWYAETIARRGLTIIALSISEALVHPWGGRRAMLGTNPVAIGVPASPRPFVLDMASSLVSMGQIHDHANRGAPIPGHWALDAQGNATTDAAAAKAGSIAPFGEAKGYALGLAFEVLVASLTGSALGRQVRGTLDSTEVCNKGDVFIVIDGASSAAMAQVIGGYLEAIRAEPPADGFAAVAIPGDRSIAARQRALADGISIADQVWAGLVRLAQRNPKNPAAKVAQS